MLRVLASGAADECASSHRPARRSQACDSGSGRGAYASVDPACFPARRDPAWRIYGIRAGHLQRRRHLDARRRRRDDAPVGSGAAHRPLLLHLSTQTLASPRMALGGADGRGLAPRRMGGRRAAVRGGRRRPGGAADAPCRALARRRAAGGGRGPFSRLPRAGAARATASPGAPAPGDVDSRAGHRPRRGTAAVMGPTGANHGGLGQSPRELCLRPGPAGRLWPSSSGLAAIAAKGCGLYCPGHGWAR